MLHTWSEWIEFKHAPVNAIVMFAASRSRFKVTWHGLTTGHVVSVDSVDRPFHGSTESPVPHTTLCLIAIDDLRTSIALTRSLAHNGVSHATQEAE